uniref:Uncharacterized protein n=1 Tax=Alexandrium catenella TaxID=2925 RepID=A0A7S1MRT1_ALECA
MAAALLAWPASAEGLVERGLQRCGGGSPPGLAVTRSLSSLAWTAQKVQTTAYRPCGSPPHPLAKDAFQVRRAPPAPAFTDAEQSSPLGSAPRQPPCAQPYTGDTMTTLEEVATPPRAPLFSPVLAHRSCRPQAVAVAVSAGALPAQQSSGRLSGRGKAAACVVPPISPQGEQSIMRRTRSVPSCGPAPPPVTTSGAFNLSMHPSSSRNGHGVLMSPASPTGNLTPCLVPRLRWHPQTAVGDRFSLGTGMSAESETSETPESVTPTPESVTLESPPVAGTTAARAASAPRDTAEVDADPLGVLRCGIAELERCIAVERGRGVDGLAALPVLKRGLRALERTLSKGGF